MNHKELIPHLFRMEFSKINAVLLQRFGMEHIETAEDIASETFLLALESWSYQGIPENPTGWLYTVAKNKARNYLNRSQVFQTKIVPAITCAITEDTDMDIDLSDRNITDSQLQMLFAICQPSLPVAAQIGLALRILCGFGIDEIANAFLTSKETINKRLYRAKEQLRKANAPIIFPGKHEIKQRLETVLTTLYLLFNEGYYSENDDAIIKKELCDEAMRLNALLVENSLTDIPAVNACYALMCFQASRLAARKNSRDEIVLYQDQDESLWDNELISKGAYYLNRAAQGDELSTYHLEASIAYWYTIKSGGTEKWKHVLHLYDQLLELRYSPVAALNRIYAMSKLHGREASIETAEALQLTGNPFYHALLGHLYSTVNKKKARVSFTKAYSLAKTNTDKLTIQQQMDKLV
ncbi:MAG: sigma-70 family RNA polymerase sigma factor [Bacteroidota bacterium]